VPEWLAEVVETVLAGLLQPTPVEIEVGYDPADGVIWFSEKGESGRARFQPSGEGRTELFVKMADWLQEQFFPETRGAWAEARRRVLDTRIPRSHSRSRIRRGGTAAGWSPRGIDRTVLHVAMPEQCLREGITASGYSRHQRAERVYRPCWAALAEAPFETRRKGVGVRVGQAQPAAVDQRPSFAPTGAPAGAPVPICRAFARS